MAINENVKRKKMMKVFLLKDVPKVGVAGEVIKVADGYGQNFLVPRKLGVEITTANENFYKKQKYTFFCDRSYIEIRDRTTSKFY